MHGLHAFLILFLGAWLAATIANQVFLLCGFARLRAYPNLNWDRLALIPRWIFWSAPHAREWQLFYRDKLTDGRMTNWRTAWTMPSNPFRWIWNPDIRRWKAIVDFCFTLLSLASRDGRQHKELFVSWAYVATAVYISGLEPVPMGGSRQFMIATMCGPEESQPPDILFVSPLFPLTGVEP